MKRILLRALTHTLALAAGFALGIYLLPILTAPPAPTASDVRGFAETPLYTATFRRNLLGSDPLHWGEGQVYLSEQGIALAGRIAPGPDYRLYLAPGRVEDKQAFLAVKSNALQVGHVRTFENFVVPLEQPTPFDRYHSVVVWCESFSQFITAGVYREP